VGADASPEKSFREVSLGRRAEAAESATPTDTSGKEMRTICDIRASSEPLTRVSRDAILAHFVMKPPMPCLPGFWWGDFSLPISWKRSLCSCTNYFLPIALLVTVNVVLAVFPAASAAVTVRRPFPPASVVRPRNAHDANVVVRGTTIGQRDTTSSLDWQHRLQAGFPRIPGRFALLLTLM